MKVLLHMKVFLHICLSSKKITFKRKKSFYAPLLTAHSFLGVSGGLAILSSDLICKELQLGLGDRSRVLAVVLIPLGDCDGSLVKLLTKALVSLCVEPRRCDVMLSTIPPDTSKKKSNKILTIKLHNLQKIYSDIQLRWQGYHFLTLHVNGWVIDLETFACTIHSENLNHADYFVRPCIN